MIISLEDGSRLITKSGSAYLPKQGDGSDKHIRTDAHFVSDAHRTIAVADGDGAHQFMATAAMAVNSHPNNLDLDPTAVFTDAISKTGNRTTRSACIVTVTRGNTVRCLNVGDGGFAVARGGKFVYQSSPSMGEEMEVEVRAWDVIVVGTNGLFDNMFKFEMEEVLKKGGSPEEVAGRMGRFAAEKGRDRRCQTPYAVGALAAGYEHHGGKYDDITVVVSCLLPLIYL